MREIKFKGRRLNDGEWEYGCFTESMGEDYIDGHLVDPTTVCQFTGFYDAEGIEIYEGDILLSVIDGAERYVKWSDGAFQAIDREDEGDNALLFYLTLVDWKVVGNIHDDDDVVTKPETPSSEPTIAERLDAIEAAIKEVRKLMEEK